MCQLQARRIGMLVAGYLEVECRANLQGGPLAGVHPFLYSEDRSSSMISRTATLCSFLISVSGEKCNRLPSGSS
jgi:hypothetical protein